MKRPLTVIRVPMGNQGPERDSVYPGSQVKEDRVATKPRPPASQEAEGLRGSCCDSSPGILPPGPGSRMRPRMRHQEGGGMEKESEAIAPTQPCPFSLLFGQGTQ